jgi:hypothetical protein
VQLAHGFEFMALDDDVNKANEKVGFFLGDRVSVALDGITTQHDPPFWTVNNFTTLTAQFHGKAAMTVACTKLTERLIPGNAKTRMIDVAKRFPVPMLWWSFFLGEPRTVRETHRWDGSDSRMEFGQKKAAANITCQWSQAACTQSTTSGSSSGVALAICPGPRDVKSIQWAAYNSNT